jgi:outer membrane receptor for ferrienterochelin and colicins
MKRQAGSVTHRGRWASATSEARVYGDTIRNLVGTVTGQINPNRATKVAADGRVNLPLGRHVLTAGGEWRRERLNDPANLAGLPGTPEFGTSTTIAVGQAAAFAEADVAVGPTLRLTVGDRFDHHEHFGGNHSPRVYAVYHPVRAVTIKGGVARAFRAPTLLQNSPQWGSPSCGSATTGCFIIGSLDLAPETSTSVEGGVQIERGRWSGGVTAFRNDLKNMIDITNRTNNPAIAPTYPNFVGFLPAGPPGFGRAIFKYQNINKVRTQGLEASMRGAIATAWTVRMNYGYLKAENLSGASPLPLVYRPVHAISGGADWLATDVLSISGTVRATGRQYISVPANGLNLVSRAGYGVVDLSAAVRLGRGASVRGGVLNVGGTTGDRLNSLDFNEEGRRYFVTLSTRF